MSIVWTDAVEELLGLLEVGNRAGAADLNRSLQAGGASETELITDLLAPAQRGVGDRWQRGIWDVAQEHLATGIVDGLLAELELRADPVQLRGDVVVGCAEGEWHALPARMLAQLLRHRGWAVTFLGPSLPATDLGRFVQQAQPVGVAISCSVTTHLAGAQRCIDAAHEVGARVAVGGPAFGPDDRRASALGADAWAPSAEAVDDVLARWAGGEQPASRTPPRDDRPDLALAAIHREVVDAALAQLRLPSSSHEVANLDALLRCVGAAMLTSDPTVLDDQVRWLRGLQPPRGDPDLVDANLAALAAALPPHLEEARRLLTAATGR